MGATFRGAAVRHWRAFLGTEFMRIVIAGGGTGGHVIPALAIAQQLKKQFGAEVLFVGTARGIETRLVPQAGFRSGTNPGWGAEKCQPDDAGEDDV